MYIKLRLLPDAGWSDPLNMGRVYEGIFIERKPSHIPGVEWITMEHPTEEFTNLYGETHKMRYGFRSDIIEILELREENVQGDVGDTSSNGT